VGGKKEEGSLTYPGPYKMEMRPAGRVGGQATKLGIVQKAMSHFPARHRNNKLPSCYKSTAKFR
jgi:hypothetical protein